MVKTKSSFEVTVVDGLGKKHAMRFNTESELMKLMFDVVESVQTLLQESTKKG